MKKVLVLLANGFEEIEAVSVIDILRRSDVIVQICSVEKEYVTGAHGIVIKSDVRIDYIDIYTDIYDLVYIPGGMPGAETLRDNDKVIKLIKTYYYKENTKMAAICAGPIVLEKAGVLDGKMGTSFPEFEEKLSYEKYLKEPVVVSENIITSRGAGTSMELGFIILEELGLKEESKKLRNEMQYDFLRDSIK